MGNTYHIPIDGLSEEIQTLEETEPPGRNLLETSIKQSYTNGLSCYVQGIRLGIFTDISKCRELWNSFSPNTSLFDLWEFRFSFYQAYKYKPYFLTILLRDEPVALLPLWFDNNNFLGEKPHYCWFGSNWNEDNTFFVRDEMYIPLLLYFSPKPLKLAAIKPIQINKSKSLIKFGNDDSKYVIDLSLYKDLDDYLLSIKKKRRHNLRRDYNKIKDLKPHFFKNRYVDLENLILMNKKRFTQKGIAVCWDDNRVTNTFYNLLRIAKPRYTPHITSLEIDKVTAAVDYTLLYKDTYYALRGSLDLVNYSGIGNYMTAYEIQDAIELGMKHIDVLQEESGWKSKWFTEIPLYKIEVL